MAIILKQSVDKLKVRPLGRFLVISIQKFHDVGAVMALGWSAGPETVIDQHGANLDLEDAEVLPGERDRTILQDTCCQRLHKVSLCLDLFEVCYVSDILGFLPIFCATNLAQICKVQLKVKIELLKLVSCSHVDFGPKKNRFFNFNFLFTEADQEGLGNETSHIIVQMRGDQVVVVFDVKLSRRLTLFGLTVRLVGNVRPRVLGVILLRGELLDQVWPLASER